MTAANMTYTDCGGDNSFSLSITCVGASCSAFQGYPNLTCSNVGSTLQCTNGVTCSGTSNYTSTLSFNQSNLSVSQIQTITTGGQRYVLSDGGTPNKTTFHGSGSSTTSSGLRLTQRRVLLVIAMVVSMFMTQVSAISYNQIIQQFSDNSLAAYLENHLEGEPYDTKGFLQDIVQAVCKAGIGFGDEFLGGPVTQCMAVLDLVTIANPVAKFAYVVLGSMLCDEIINGILQGIPGQVEGSLCNALASAVGLSGPATSTSPIGSSLSSSSLIQSLTTSSPSPLPPSSSPLPTSTGVPGPALPGAAALAQDQCVACLLSLYYLGVQGLARQCGVASPKAVAYDLSVVFCDPSTRSRYSQLCTSLCANQCGTYDLQTLITAAGAAFMPSASLALCSQLCPGYAGAGRCNAIVPACACGLGASSCVTLC